jgi:UDP-3-O-[3-hydroxymyristoyl] N-acetylglucosamine deacetylase/3-hydroxyacyl-[acyl-carrier-protein] dehydratase
MSVPKQQTIASEAALDGIGLHTGQAARIRFRPAEPNTGIRFKRVDLPNEPEIRANLDSVSATDRGTTLGEGEARVHTVEHVLGAVMAQQLDNLVIEVHGPEMPIGDGSFRPFFELLSRAGTQTQDERASVLVIEHALTFDAPGGASYIATPGSAFVVSATIEFDHPLVRRQYASFEVTPAGFAEDLAPARTFGFLREAEELRARGLAKGATTQNAIVLDEVGLVEGELRFPDEFVRHKIGDVIGDLALVGSRIQGHVVTERPSHAGTVGMAREMLMSGKRSAGLPVADIQRIMRYLPHRYPFLLVDRITEFEPHKRIVGLKNVTINEPFFQGHFPGHPIMPGVLIIEAMAQVGGMLLMDAIEQPENKLVFFMSADKIKWRRPVVPGDQIRFEIDVIQLRTTVAKMRGVGLVDGQVVAEAEMMARIVDR